MINPLGGFHDLDDRGRPTAPGYGATIEPSQYLLATSRFIHAYAIAAGRAPTLLSIAEWISRLGLRRVTTGASAMMAPRTQSSRPMATPLFLWQRAIGGQGVDLLEKRGWDDRAGDMIEV